MENNKKETKVNEKMEGKTQGKDFVTTVANPIYDTVFKYLMEDERIARTILSALLQKDVLSVEMRPQEFADDKNGKISLYRIDFGATVREKDGTERRILIELQKSTADGETLRFRQYLGFQYNSPENVGSDGFSIPMVTIYLLGHMVGDIEEPVVYVSRKIFDHNGREITKGLPNPFIDSLTHDSIIVQIPRLHGQVNNRLDEVLSFFDQRRKVGQNPHLLEIDESLYGEDPDMQRILTRLLKAAASAEIRRKMNIEDEIFSAIEKRDTIILQKDKQLEEQSLQLEEQSHQLEARNQEILRQKELLRISVRTLLGNGLSEDAVAASLGITPQDIKELLEE